MGANLIDAGGIRIVINQQPTADVTLDLPGAIRKLSALLVVADLNSEPALIIF